jgi:hypothetical protein
VGGGASSVSVWAAADVVEGSASRISRGWYPGAGLLTVDQDRS